MFEARTRPGRTPQNADFAAPDYYFSCLRLAAVLRLAKPRAFSVH
jgi:hypothetical protein